MYTQLLTVRTYVVFNNAIATGYDKEKCLNGIEDLTKLKDIDKSQNWCEKLVACKIINCTSDEAIKAYKEAEVNFIRVEKNI